MKKEGNGQIILRPRSRTFGGKSTVVEYLWTRFGEVDNFVDPFMGSCAVLLNRPDWDIGVRHSETVNDVDGFLVNFWRSIQADPEAVAHHADHPVFESDIHARHAWLLARSARLTERLEGDPTWYNARMAGWWAWGVSCWIGSGWCAGDGPWIQADGPDGYKILTRKDKGESSNGVGVSRQLPKFGGPLGVKRIIPKTNRNGVLCTQEFTLVDWLTYLAERFRYVRVCCGDWTRVCTDSTTIHSGKVTAVFCDPPYTKDGRGSDFKSYRNDDLDVAHAVRAWCIERGPDPRFRIALCGYQGEHDELIEKHGWGFHDWKGPSGYANQGETDAKEMRKLERVWLSPHVLPEKQKPSLGFFK